MIASFRSIHPGTVYRYEVSKVTCRGSYVYFWRDRVDAHYYLEYDVDSGRLLEYRPELNYDAPYEYNTISWDVVS